MKDKMNGGHNLLTRVYYNPTFPEFGRPCDTHLKADDGAEFKVYSKLLSKNSEFFESLFCYDEADGHSVVIHGIDSNTLEKVLVYLYTRYVNLNTKNMMDLLVASDFLLIEPLLLKCRRFVAQNISLENCLKIFLTAHRIKELDLKERCYKFILLSCPKAVMLSNKKQGYNYIRNSIENFLSNESLNAFEKKIICSYIDGKEKGINSYRHTYSSISAVYNNPAFSEFGRPCDTHLKTDDGAEFKVHSEYLSNHSEFFKSLFSHDEVIGQSVVIHGIKSDILERVLIYLHTKRDGLNTENMLDLLVASDFFMIEPLLSECRWFVLENMNQENCIDIFLTVHRIKELEVEDKSRRFILLGFEKVVKLSRNKAYDLPYVCVKYLLSNRSLNVSQEKVVWSFIEGWVKRDKSNRLSVVPQLLGYLCINDIDDKLASCIITSPIIRQNELYKDIGDPRVTLHTLSDKQKALKIISYRNDIPPYLVNRLPRSVYFITKASLFNDKVEMFISYDHRLDLWRKVGQKRSFYLHTLLRVGHRVYIFKSHKCIPKFNKKAYAYDVSTNKTLPMATVPSAKHYSPRFFLALEASGHIYALQVGHNQSQVTFQRYVDATDEWTSLAPDPITFPMAGVTLNGLVYVVGFLEMRVYDPSSDAWKTVSPPNKVRMEMLAAAFEGKIFLVGGYAWFGGVNGNEDSPKKAVEVYDPVDDEWSVHPEVPFGVSVTDSGLAVVKGRLFVYRKRPPYSAAYWDGTGEWRLVDGQSPLLHMCLYSFCVIEGDEAVGKIAEINRAVDAWKWIDSGLGEEVLLKSYD